MEKLKTLLDIPGSNLKFVKFSELEIRKKYHTSSFEFIKTKYGEKLTVVLDNEFKLVLPDRLSKLTKKDVQDLNLDNNYFFIYNGMEILTNGYKQHLITFEKLL